MEARRNGSRFSTGCRWTALLISLAVTGWVVIVALQRGGISSLASGALLLVSVAVLVLLLGWARNAARASPAQVVDVRDSLFIFLFLGGGAIPILARLAIQDLTGYSVPWLAVFALGLFEFAVLAAVIWILTQRIGRHRRAT